MTDYKDVSWDEIKQIVAGLSFSQAKTDRQIKENARQIKENTRRLREADLYRKEIFRQIKEMQAETERKFQASKIEMDCFFKESGRRLEKFGLIQGEVAEDLFRRNIKALLEKVNIKVDKIITNMKEDETREYDLVAINGQEVVVFEVKNKLRSSDLEWFAKTQLPQFKTGFPRFKNFRVHGGVGALVVKQSLEQEARKKGLFVLTQGADDSAKLIKPDRLAAY